MPLSYNATVTGSVIDSAIKAKTSSMTGEASKESGKILWETVLELLYTDFKTTLAQSIMLYLQSAQVIFLPSIPVPMMAIMPIINLQHKPSATLLYNTIINQTSILRKNAIQSAGAIIWTEFCKQVGQDILNNFPEPICRACDSAVTLVPMGFMAPPMISSFSPAPPIYTGLQSSILKGLMTGFFGTLIASLGPSIDSAIKAKTSLIQNKNISQAGAIVWNTILEILIPAITLQLGTAIQLFLTQSVGIWQTTPVPGLPWIPAGPGVFIPTPGISPSPANILII